MQQILTMIHILIAVAIIGLVLIQHGKGADMGAGFGSGASQTMFGSAGSTPFLVKITGLLAAAFFVNCLLLTYAITKSAKTTSSVDLINSAPSSVPAQVTGKAKAKAAIDVAPANKANQAEQAKQNAQSKQSAPNKQK